MGINFKERKYGQIGEIIYPAYNGTNGFWNKPRWDLITLVDKKGKIILKRYIWDIATVNAIQLIQIYPKILKYGQK